MALKSFGRGGEGDGPGIGAAPSPAASQGAGPGGLTAFIDQGSEFEGKLQFRDTVRIDGKFRGEISSENTLIVGESGEIEASIRSKTISISGSVDGDVTAANKVVLHKTARVNGNVESPSLQMEDGAVLNGMVKMVPAGGGSNKLKSVSGNGGSSKPADKQ
ncbi:MAG: bactofilin family protein [Myxococcota bacterium]